MAEESKQIATLLRDYVAHCINTDQLQVAALVEGAADEIERLQAERDAYRSIAGYAMDGTNEVDELAKLPPLERDREVLTRKRDRFFASLKGFKRVPDETENREDG